MLIIIAYFLGLVLAIVLISLIIPYFTKKYYLQQKNISPKLNEEYAQELTGKLTESINSYPFPKLPNKDVDESRIVLLVKNPHWLHAFWEISSTYTDSLIHKFGDKWTSAVPFLRVYELPNVNALNSRCLFDIEISQDIQNWNINVLGSNKHYYVELGRKLDCGHFVPILRSETVTTPRYCVSAAIDENWIPWDIYQGLEHIRYGLSSPEQLQRKD
ncbi:MAG: DUF4912 domain-containing protein [Bacillota bacterium]|jgi:hypothetical protein